MKLLKFISTSVRFEIITRIPTAALMSMQCQVDMFSSNEQDGQEYGE